jgi:hypothetical protein
MPIEGQWVITDRQFHEVKEKAGTRQRIETAQ